MRAQIRIRCSSTLAYRFSSKRETYLQSIYLSVSSFLLFSDRFNWRNNNTSNHEFSFKISAWPCHGIDTGENNAQVWKTVQVLYFGAREHLFIVTAVNSMSIPRFIRSDQLRSAHRSNTIPYKKSLQTSVSIRNLENCWNIRNASVMFYSFDVSLVKRSLSEK